MAYGLPAVNQTTLPYQISNYTNNPQIPQNNSISSVRVTDIILDDSHKRFEELGGWDALGTILCLGLVAGSFYLSLNGAHRLVDTSDKIETTVDQTISLKTDSIAKYYDK